MNHFADKTFVVTGATSGVGKLLVQNLIKLGANVAFCGRSPAKLDNLIASLAEPKGKIFYQAFDITDFETIPCFVKTVQSELGSIDCLVNCAGANSARDAVNHIQMSDLQAMLDVNMLAPFTFMKEIYNQSMASRGNGMIINVMSTVCLFSNSGIGAYTASKSGFDALSKVFRKEVRENGVKVCAIYPGGVDTPFRDVDRPQYLGAEDVVNAVLSMVSQSEKSVVDELVIRPMIEHNF